MKSKVMGIIGSLATILMVYSYVPQLILTYGTQNVDGQSLQFWLVLTTALALIDIIQIDILINSKEKRYGVVIFQTMNLLLALAMVVGVMLFS